MKHKKMFNLLNNIKHTTIKHKFTKLQLLQK